MRFMLDLKKDYTTFAMLVASVSTIFPLRETVIASISDPSSLKAAEPTLSVGSTVKKFYPIHKSVVDWLTRREHDWKCDPKEGHLLISKKLLGQVGVQLSTSALGFSGGRHEEWSSFISQIDSLTWWEHWLGLSSALAFSLLQGSGEKEPPATPPSPLGDKIVPLKRYCLQHVLEHLDGCDKDLGYQRLSYLLLTNLSFIQAVLESAGLSSLRYEYRKRVRDESWMTADGYLSQHQDSDQGIGSAKKDIKLMMQFCDLLLSLEKDRQSAWATEICTQINGRLRNAAKRSPLLAQLLAATETFKRAHGGWLLKKNCFTTPGGDLGVEKNFNERVISIVAYPLRENQIIIGDHPHLECGGQQLREGARRTYK